MRLSPPLVSYFLGSIFPHERVPLCLDQPTNFALHLRQTITFVTAQGVTSEQILQVMVFRLDPGDLDVALGRGMIRKVAGRYIPNFAVSSAGVVLVGHATAIESANIFAVPNVHDVGGKVVFNSIRTRTPGIGATKATVVLVNGCILEVAVGRVVRLKVLRKRCPQIALAIITNELIRNAGIVKVTLVLTPFLGVAKPFVDEFSAIKTNIARSVEAHLVRVLLIRRGHGHTVKMTTIAFVKGANVGVGTHGRTTHVHIKIALSVPFGILRRHKVQEFFEFHAGRSGRDELLGTPETASIQASLNVRGNVGAPSNGNNQDFGEVRNHGAAKITWCKTGVVQDIVALQHNLVKRVVNDVSKNCLCSEIEKNIDKKEQKFGRNFHRLSQSYEREKVRSIL